MQNRIFWFTLFIATTSLHGLKLLTDTDQKSKFLEDDDEQWESEIEFSYKPFPGKCKNKATGSQMQPSHETPKDVSATNTKGYTENGEIANYPCTEHQTPKDQAKYCVAPGAAQNLNTQLAGWATYAEGNSDPFRKPWSFAKWAHYVTKMASMGNIRQAIPNSCGDGDANCVDFVKSIEIGITASNTYAYEAFKEVAGDGVTSAQWFCYTEKGIAWAKNDPIVKNMQGQEFEIMATGTFSMLSVKEEASRSLFEASATIDRAGTRCGATYIQNITLSGKWVEDLGAPRIEVKAVAAVPKAQALQVLLDGNSSHWQHATSWRLAAPWQLPMKHPDTVQTANALKFVLKLNRITVTASVDAHRIHEGGAKTNRFANFLNVDFQGFSDLAGLSVGGLLGKDSHEDATKLPEGCDSAQLVSSDVPNQFSHVNVA